MNNKCLWFICCLLCFWYTLAAQDIPMIHFTTRDGLPSNTVYDIYKDSKGLLWFGTDKGIAVYNGIYFKYYTTYNGLPDNDVFYFREDYQNRIWISTYSGALCYYKDGVFHTEENTPFLKLPFKSIQTYISFEKDSSVTILFRNNERFINIHNNKVEIFDISRLFLIPYEHVIVEKVSQNVYRLFFSNRIVEINNKNSICRSLKSPAGALLNCRQESERFFLRDSGIYTARGALFYPLKKLPIMTNQTEIVAFFDRQNIFLCTYNGLFINNNIHLFPQKRITNVCADINGNYWIASINNEGVYWLNKNYLKPVEYKSVYKGKIRQVCGKDGLFLFSTEYGNIYQFDKRKKFTLLHEAIGSQDGLYRKSFIDDSLNVIIFPGKGSYVYRHIGNNTFFKKKVIIPEQNPGYLNNIVLAKNGKVYLFQRSDVRPINYNAFKKTLDWREEEKFQTGKGNRIFSSTRDREGNPWFSTATNVWKIVDTQAIIQHQFKNTGFRRFLFFGNCLIGYTGRNELLLVRNYTSKPIVDTIKNQNCVWDMIFPIDSRHLIITSNGYNRLLTIDSVPLFKYSVKAIENPFLPIQAEYIIRLGEECCFFGNGTITCIPFKSLLGENYVPEIFFSTLNASGKLYMAHKPVQLSYAASKNINLQFVPLSFTGKEIICQYSISENTKDNWKTISGNEINFAALPSGRYNIKVRVRTAGSQYSKPAIFTLTITKPYWEEWWFRGLVAILISGCAYLLVKLMIRSSVRKKQKEFETVLKVQQSEYKALNSLMNPHFIFNSLNNIQSLIKKDDKATANKYLVIFSNMVRQNMHNIHKEKVTVRKELELVELYLKLEKLRFKERFEYKLNISEIEELDDIYIPALLVQPLVENSIKHGLLPRKEGDNIVYIDVYKTADMLYLIIGDNGVGLAEIRIRKDHESFALTNIHERIRHFNALYKQDISFELKNRMVAGKVTGTVATIKIALLYQS